MGARRTLTLGFSFQCLGYFFIAYSALSGSYIYLYAGLGFVVIGRAIGNTAPPIILSSVYKDKDSRLDSAFTYLYMINNIGAFLAQLVAPIIYKLFGAPTAFALSGIGMAINVIGFVMMRKLTRQAGTEADHRHISSVRMAGYTLGALVAVAISSYLLKHLTITHYLMGIAAVVILVMIIRVLLKESVKTRIHMLVGLILMVQAYLFFILYNQMPTSLNFFALHNIEPSIFGIAVPAASFQAFNPFWIIVLSPVLASFYNYLDNRGKDPSMPAKFAFGMFFCAIAFGMAGVSRFFADEQGMLSSFWIGGPHLFFAIGELLISALGQSMIAKLFPRHIRGFSFGAWNMTLALASVSGAWVASFSATSETAGEVTTPLETLSHYSHYFLYMALATLVICVLCALFAPKLARMIDDEPESGKELQTAEPA